MNIAAAWCVTHPASNDRLECPTGMPDNRTGVATAFAEAEHAFPLVFVAVVYLWV